MQVADTLSWRGYIENIRLTGSQVSSCKANIVVIPAIRDQDTYHFNKYPLGPSRPDPRQREKN